MLVQWQTQKLNKTKVSIRNKQKQEFNKLEKMPLMNESNEAMTKKDAALFPIILSAYLFGLYILFKIVEKSILQILLTGFFSLMGV